MVTRADYGGLRLHPEQSTFQWSAPLVAQHLRVYLTSLGQQFTWPGVALGMWGIARMRQDRWYRFLLISLAVSGPGFVILSNLPPAEATTLPILEPHLVLANVLFAAFIAAAAERLVSYKTGTVLFTACLIAAGAMNLRLCNYRSHFYAYDYGRHVLHSIPPDGCIYNPDDTTAFITTYLSVVEHKREDIALIAYYRTRWGYERLRRRYPQLLPGREIRSGIELERVVLDHNRTRRGIFAELPSKFPAGYVSYPSGILFRLQEKDEYLPSVQPFEFYALRNDYRPRREYDFFTNQIISYYSSARNNAGLAYASLKEYDLARRQYDYALAINPGLVPAWNNRGTLEYSLGKYAAAELWFRKVVEAEGENPSALYNLGLAFLAQEETGPAKAMLSAAWEKTGYPDAGNQLGLIALSDERYEVATDLFGKIVSRYPGYSAASYNLGLALEKVGMFKESKAAYEQYLNMVSDPRERREVQLILQRIAPLAAPQ